MRHETQFSPQLPVYAFHNSQFTKQQTLIFLQSIPPHLFTPSKWGVPGRPACMMMHIAGWGGTADPVSMVACRLNLHPDFVTDIMRIFDKTEPAQAKAVAIALIKAIPVNEDTSRIAEFLSPKMTLEKYLQVMRARPWKMGPFKRFLVDILPSRFAQALYA